MALQHGHELEIMVDRHVKKETGVQGFKFKFQNGTNFKMRLNG